MISIDNTRFSSVQMHRLFAELSGKREFRHCSGRLFAACLQHPFETIGLALFAREQGAGVLLLHESTPLERAREMSRQAGAHFLIYGNLGNEAEPIPSDAGRSSALYQFSSGTTGAPKLIRRSWNEIDREIASYNLRLNAGEEPIVCVPVSHSFGLICGVLSAIERQVEPRVIHDKNPKFAMKAIRETPNSIVYAVPYLLHLYETLGKGQLRYSQLVSSGAPLTEALLDRLKSASIRIWQQYGCSETGCISLGCDIDSPFDVGRPLDHQTVFLQPLGTDSDLSEIVAASDDRVVHTRDVGYIGDTGSLFVTGRSDDLINVSGLKVVPSEVESVIARMEGVSETVVYRTRHKVWGDAVKALVVASPGTRERDIQTWCARHLPSYKIPGVIRLVDEIPKLPSGKISRKLLREQEELA